MAQQLVLECQFDAFQALVVHPGEADDMRRHFTRRVIATIFLILTDSWQLQRCHPITHFRRQLSLQENKRFFTSQPARQLLDIHFQQGGQLPSLIRRQLGLRRNGPDGFHRRRYGKNVAIAVGDTSA